jgi:hypothetical protein
MPSVLQDWVHNLSFMQQSVLLTATRGPDGVVKEHPAKDLLRWYRRCFLISAFEKKVFTDPYEQGGGSFTGPLIIWDRIMIGKVPTPTSYPINNGKSIDNSLTLYINSLDAIPHHFQLHFLHAVEILGYKHPIEIIRVWWNKVYLALVHDMHLFPETEEQMDRRLGDSESQWKEREEYPIPSNEERFKQYDDRKKIKNDNDEIGLL